MNYLAKGIHQYFLSIARRLENGGRNLLGLQLNLSLGLQLGLQLPDFGRWE